MLPPYGSLRLKVEQFCQRRLEMDHSDVSSLWLLSNLYVWRKEYSSAKGPLERLVAERKGQRGPLLLLSRVYFNLNDYDAVERLLKSGEFLTPTDSENYYLGVSLLELGQFSEAAALLAVYTNHHRKSWQPFVHLGYASFKAGYYRQAMQAYKAAQRINPSAREIQDSIELCRKKVVEAES